MSLAEERTQPAARVGSPLPAARRDPYTPGWLTFVRTVCRRLARVLLRVRVTGADHLPGTGPVLVAGNHSGFLDGPLVVLFASRPVRTLVKAELYGGVLGELLERAGQIPVRRGRPDRRALHRALEVLRAEGVVGVFPEGTRGTGELEQVQHGIAWLALHAGCPIVPVCCLGTAQALPRGRHLPRFRSPVSVVFGAPFEVATPTNPRARSAVAASAEEIRLRLAAHLADSRRRYG